MPSMIIGTKHEGAVGIKARCLCLFAVSPRVTDTAGVEVVPWSVNSIPAVYADEVPDAWKNGIAVGDAGWMVTEVEQRVGESVAAFTAYAWVHFDAVVALEIAKRRAEAAETGDYDLQRFSLSR